MPIGLTLCQSIFESGGGTSNLAQHQNNFFRHQKPVTIGEAIRTTALGAMIPRALRLWITDSLCTTIIQTLSGTDPNIISSIAVAMVVRVTGSDYATFTDN